jgi:hypothetical protein
MKRVRIFLVSAVLIFAVTALGQGTKSARVAPSTNHSFNRGS